MTSLSSILYMLFSFLLIVLVGHLGENELAAGALSFVFCNVTGYSLISGLLTAFETLSSQAYGSKKYHLIGVLVQRSLFLCFCILLLISPLWFYADKVLILLHQDVAVSQLVGIYTRWNILAMIPSIIIDVLRRYLQTQSIATPLFIARGISLVAGIGFAYLGIYVFGFGFSAAPFANLVYNAVNCAVCLGYIKYRNLHELTWKGWTLDLFQDIVPYLKLAGPGMVMTCAEWWASEILAIFAGWKSVIAVDVNSIITQYEYLTYMLPMGSSVAASTRVGNALGANDPDAGIRAVKVGLTTALFSELFQASIILALRYKIGYITSNSAEVVAGVAEVAIILCIILPGDGINVACNGILRGMGRQNFGAVVNLGLYYLVALPLAYVLAFPAKLGVTGLWIALTVGSYCVSIIYLIFILGKADWKEEARKAVERIRNEEKHLDGHPEDQEKGDTTFAELEPILDNMAAVDLDEDSQDLETSISE